MDGALRQWSKRLRKTIDFRILRALGGVRSIFGFIAEHPSHLFCAGGEDEGQDALHSDRLAVEDRRFEDPFTRKRRTRHATSGAAYHLCICFSPPCFQIAGTGDVIDLYGGQCDLHREARFCTMLDSGGKSRVKRTLQPLSGSAHPATILARILAPWL